MANVVGKDESPNLLLSKPWQKFLAKFDEIDSLPTSKWKEVHFLGCICRKYQQLFEKPFALSYKGAPSKCPEIYMIKKIMAMLGTTNPHTIRAYVEWVFETKVVLKDVRFRSLGFFTTPSFGNEFHIAREKKLKIEKSTELPTEYKQVATTLELSVNTYGDLAFIKMALDESPDGESRAPYRLLFNNLMAIGFEPAILKGMV